VGFLSKLFGKRQSPGTNETKCKVQFDANGKVLNIEIPQNRWALKRTGQNTYYTQKADSLLQAAEILKKIASIPQLAYYMVDTPDGSLGRDTHGYYTEAPIKTASLIVEFRSPKTDTVASPSLKGFGDMGANHSSVAYLKKSGHYARVVLLMKCGNCGYESPVETEQGSLVRECYCCGVENKGDRAGITVILGSNVVVI
jgi:hypothetical protein